MTIEILALSAGNTELLQHIAADVFDNPIDPQQLAKFVADPRHFMVLAWRLQHIAVEESARR
jgi:hypothetical protein